MNKQEQLAEAISVATRAHSKQFDKGGKPYVLHPLHLMSQLMYDTELATIAVLHDVVEDSDFDLYYFVFNKYSRRVIEALDLLTHKKEDTYEQYINKISTSYDAIRVKLEDLAHNSDITRLKGVSVKDLDRMEKYHRAYLLLSKTKAGYEVSAHE